MSAIDQEVASQPEAWERAGRLDHALGHHPLPFAEKVGQDALIGDRDRILAVGHLEAHREIVAAHHGSGLDQTAEPDAAARRHVPLHHVGR